MTGRDRAWRTLGVALIAAGYGLTLVAGEASGHQALVGLLSCGLAALGLVLLIQGRRVPQALRIERSGHRALPQLIHRRRLGRPTPR